MIKLFILLILCYCVLRMLRRKYPNSGWIEIVEFLTGLLEGFLVCFSVGLFMLFVIGCLILL